MSSPPSIRRLASVRSVPPRICLRPSVQPRRSGRGGEAPRLGALEDTMTTEQKIIRAKVGLLELAKQLGNVSQDCKMMGFCNGPSVVNPSLALSDRRALASVRGRRE